MVGRVQPSVVDLARRAAEPGDPKVALGAIADLRRRLDELEEYHVETALARGASWSAVGAALGVSKQAAHKRFATRVGSPAAPSGARIVVTGAARLSVRLARAEAARAGVRLVAPEHLLLGLLRLPAGQAAAILVSGGVTRAGARAVLARARGRPVSPRHVGISRRTRAVLERALDEAVARGDNELRDLHVLLAVLHAGGPRIHAGLVELGVDPRELIAATEST